MPASFGVVDLFAGPGGLGEGFASLRPQGREPFHIGVSVEKEASAHRTLRLRAFLRAFQARRGLLPGEFVAFHAGLRPEPDWAALDAGAWAEACAEARALELGSESAASAVDEAVVRMRGARDDLILIGGPPCQAYSLVGRARSKGNRDYVPEQDHRHYLFREYVRVLDRIRPAAFVMENVKGMLSSTVESRLVFEMLMEDLSSLGAGRGHLYELRAIRIEEGEARLREARKPADFIVRAEEFGVPQRRHRVIVVGIRSDLAAGAAGARLALPGARRTVRDATGALPALRSGLSRGADSPEAWRDEVIGAALRLAGAGGAADPLRARFADLARSLAAGPPPPRASSALPEGYGESQDELLRWLERPGLRALAQHETRGHMASDLGRYLFAAVFGELRGQSPRAADFPSGLSPDHRSWGGEVFSDRFRTQLAAEPATTVTSHISKDGHYFIHPDPAQCRSLTLREAARLQSFPDDYLFLGNRTQQYVQVGNAVPPLLARRIAELLLAALSPSSPPERAPSSGPGPVRFRRSR
ncbi:DNA cytosine methyltransferase [Neomegalonema sp.]|uniref:DNA cytosine methyltransferase n=1 Tax=Neomegalonema sp. TaxID=2039713 RepID=UPI002638998A|nr:DNA cytosine methyltransferase [Neomegalonema sp.]MDD2868648.1 DNA cytosine methyltransferase [Neomegalonema sp.]